jgi:steroid delta-isomerase-like uncharacterized protein
VADVRWIHDFVAAWNSQDGPLVGTFLAEDCYWEDTAVGQRGEGRDYVVKNWSKGFSSVFPDAHFEVEHVVCDDEGYAIQWRWTGTHQASGRGYDIRGASAGRHKNGLVVGQTDYWNAAAMTKQLGGPIF